MRQNEQEALEAKAFMNSSGIISFLAFMRRLVFFGKLTKHKIGLALLFVYYMMSYLTGVYSLFALSYLRCSE